MRNHRGVNLVEIMIVVAICGIIGAGLFSLLKYVTMSGWTISAKIELQQNAREALSRISQDFKAAKASSIGNMGYNSGLEQPEDIRYPAGAPLGWQSPLPANVERIGTKDDNLKSGFYALKLVNPANLAETINYETIYESNVSTFEVTGDYLMSCWIKAEGAAEAHLLRPDGVEFSTKISTGCASSTGYWQYFNLITKKEAGTLFKIRLTNKTPGTSAYFDDISIAPLEIIFDAAGPSGEIRYEKYKENNICLYRLYFDAPNQCLYRQFFNGENWIDEGPNPLCKYLKKVIIRNYNQQSFSISLVLAKYSRKDKEEIYQLDSTITPLLK